MMANVWPAGQTLTHAGFLNDSRWFFINLSSYIEFNYFSNSSFQKMLRKLQVFGLELKSEK